jgi:hypothetical protein
MESPQTVTARTSAHTNPSQKWALVYFRLPTFTLRLRDPLRAKQRNKGLLELGEEGVPPQEILRRHTLTFEH